jgi:hypothetical protein
LWHIPTKQSKFLIVTLGSPHDDRDPNSLEFTDDDLLNLSDLEKDSPTDLSAWSEEETESDGKIRKKNKKKNEDQKQDKLDGKNKNKNKQSEKTGHQKGQLGEMAAFGKEMVGLAKEFLGSKTNIMPGM